MGRKCEKGYSYDIGLAFVHNGKILSYEKVISRLNSLEKENECLKSQLDKIPSKIKEVWLEDD